MSEQPVVIKPIIPIYDHLIREIEKYIPKGSKVLELGADLQANLSTQLLEKGYEITALNPAPNFTPHVDINYSRADARTLPFKNESFNCVVSVNTFECMQYLPLVINESYRVLEKEGYLITIFGPLWSSAKGHSLWAKYGDDVVSFCDKSKRCPLDDFDHLLLSPLDMEQKLSKLGECKEMRDAIIDAVFKRTDMNRLFLRDYMSIFTNSRFLRIRIDPYNVNPIDTVIYRKLEEMWGREDFNVSSLIVVLKKPKLF